MKKIPALLAVLLIVIMFAAVVYTNQKAIIFPEIAALALGAWVMETPPWYCTNLSLWLSPSLAALTGMIIVRYFPYSPVFMTAGAFAIVILQLKLLRSAIMPSISAAILPVITHCDSWYYPLSVFVLTGTIAFGRLVMNRYASAGFAESLLKIPELIKSGDDVTASELKHCGKLLAGVVAVSVIAAKCNLLFMIAPPLIVAFVELSKPDGTLRRKSRSILFLLVFAAFSGVLWLYFITNVLLWPIWIFACLATTSVFLMYRFMRLPFPPAVAIALLPAIIPTASLWSYPWHVLFGSSAFILISMLWFGKNNFAFMLGGRYD
jgi:hypothetical protein